MGKAVRLGSSWAHPVHASWGEDSAASGQDEENTVVMASQEQGTLSESSLGGAVPIAGTSCHGLGSYHGREEAVFRFPSKAWLRQACLPGV